MPVWSAVPDPILACPVLLSEGSRRRVSSSRTWWSSRRMWRAPGWSCSASSSRSGCAGSPAGTISSSGRPSPLDSCLFLMLSTDADGGVRQLVQGEPHLMDPVGLLLAVGEETQVEVGLLQGLL